MKVLLQTSNPLKVDEYRRHLALYGLSRSVETDPSCRDEASVLAWLRQAGGGSFVLREESDLFLHGDAPIARPYRTAGNDGAEVRNVSRATVRKLDAAGSVEVTTYEASIPGSLRIVAEVPEVFDWDDVFVPDRSSRSYHEAKAGPGKLSSRSLVLDRVVADHVPFRSGRALKYGRLNADGMVDLNHWPIHPSSAIQFARLPIDFLTDGPLADLPALEDCGIGTMLRSALSGGAHFRAARSRREWIYWAPGINAGIPLTPKEDPSAELVYLVPDFAHYPLPDLLVDVPSSPAVDLALVMHRMVGETMAMVMADMFFMDALLRSGWVADADRHGIHRILALSDLGGVPDGERFFTMLRATAAALLLGNAGPLLDLTGRDRQAADAVELFMTKYRRFALADYEWTNLNLRQFRDGPERMRAWLAMMPEGHLRSVGLETASGFLGRVGIGSADRVEPARILGAVLDDVIRHGLAPRMRSAPVDRDGVLHRSLKRYLTGQLALYARYPDHAPSLDGRKVLIDALSAERLDLGSERVVRAALERDLAALEGAWAITPLDRSIYASVFPIVDARYVSYANPNLATHAEAFAFVTGDAA